MHKDPAHADSSPVGFEKARESGIIASEAKRRGDGKFKFSEVSEQGGLHRWRNGLAMVLTFKGMRLDADLEEGTVDAVKSKQARQRSPKRRQLQGEASW